MVVWHYAHNISEACPCILYCSGLEVSPHYLQRIPVHIFLWCSWVLYLCTRPDSAFSNSLFFSSIFLICRVPSISFSHTLQEITQVFPSCVPLASNYWFSLLLQLSFEFMKGYDFVLSRSFCCFEVMLFPGFHIVGGNSISYISMEPFTCVYPFISKNITEYFWLPGQLWSSHSTYYCHQMFIISCHFGEWCTSKHYVPCETASYVYLVSYYVRIWVWYKVSYKCPLHISREVSLFIPDTKSHPNWPPLRLFTFHFHLL